MKPSALGFFAFWEISVLISVLMIGSWRRGEIPPERMKKISQSSNDAQLGMCLVVRVKSNALKNNIG